MDMNYYVVWQGCADACEHCPEQSEAHLGKATAGKQFQFTADPAWPRNRAFQSWYNFASSGEIQTEDGDPLTLANLLQVILEHKDGARSESDGIGSFEDRGCWFATSEFA